ncbi:uncharacterized protein LOC142984820 [Anticarsia gemmatalis]|uniref:uncharacterized protein LOC142984820 n=1 Tax=Anticarsia gemmatalis TaxID=129554 RepID=UPI003F7670FB
MQSKEISKPHSKRCMCAKRKCICNTDAQLDKITKIPYKLSRTELNNIRLNLFTERNSDGTGNLMLRGKDLQDRYDMRVMDTDIKAICHYVKSSTRRITKIDLSYNRITDKGFFKLLKRILVKGRSSVLNLNIMNNRLSAESICNLAKYAKYMKLQELRLNGNKFGTKAGECLAKFLMDNKTVEYLDIGETSQTLSSVAHIITALRIDHGANTTLRVFDFSRIIPLFNRYSYETKWLAYHIEYLLERNSSIIELHLQKNEFISHDVEYFARGLRRNDTLLHLDLGYNKIGDYGIELIAKFLAEKPPLIILNVAANTIHDLGARALSLGMPYSKIRSLDISANKLTDEGLLDLLNTIKKSFRMRFFNIWGNKIGHPTCFVMSRMLESGVLIQEFIDVKLYEVDEVIYAAYYPNPFNRDKHIYYDELETGVAQPIYHITRNVVPEKKNTNFII